MFFEVRIKVEMGICLKLVGLQVIYDAQKIHLPHIITLEKMRKTYHFGFNRLKQKVI